MLKKTQRSAVRSASLSMRDVGLFCCGLLSGFGSAFGLGGGLGLVLRCTHLSLYGLDLAGEQVELFAQLLHLFVHLSHKRVAALGGGVEEAEVVQDEE